MAAPAVRRCVSVLGKAPAAAFRALGARYSREGGGGGGSNRAACLACNVTQYHQHVRLLSSRNRPEGKVLETVGVFEAPKQLGKYETGQLFLHSIFGYRGIVLFPWHARLYDRDVASCSSDSKTESAEGSQGSKEVKGKTHTYYQVLIDTRDCPHISQRSQTEAVTFLANHDDSRALYAIPGLDYVSHEDILPYSSSDRNPIQHELFERFLSYEPAKALPFAARDTLRAWQEKNHPWLELSDVHRETTENIRVTVIPFYMGMREAQNSHVYWWRYCIRLENLGAEVVQLRERHWRIFSLSGTLETVRGRGVVGREPVLSKEQPAFQYSSHVSLQAPSGHMWGSYTFQRADSTTFDVSIPSFSLESSNEDDGPFASLV
ncbi:polymerase delta-interacting protein 2 isoform X3 [Callorhinchus milii]|uniref:Polymerase (DNA-directed), delta interacting protein 2 n=2 Tax=Callorhinchus milii TaxID=7868 RepID=A0A4W3JAQ5_CALMI|nr:polymerase delta-interacting protein 2 isoform X3 [Callorhinchus milii]|eukprot:gi/632957780/ref/XP_007894670.1/ PREDICTED: polymerase delta-interacting protein 2 isoform X3 [Callorhinchus milii]